MSFVTICLIPVACLGAIWDCDNVYIGISESHIVKETLIAPKDFGAFRCTGEGGGCHGPGRIYYGAALSWTYKDATANGYVYCGDNFMGCDPLDGIHKECYNGCSMYHECPKDVTLKWFGTGASVTIPSFSMCNCDDVRDHIRLTMELDEDFAPHVTDAVVEQAYTRMECAPETPRLVGVEWQYTKC